MQTNVQLLCQDLDHLLKDICDFLSNQINDENFTENQRLFANKLIQRSKKQLQQISKVSVTLSTDVDDSSYVDMNKQSVPEAEEVTYEDGDIPEYLTPIDECTDHIDNGETITCPYELLPAVELEKFEKFGHLDKKERFLFIGHQRRLFAGIKDNWLLLYCTKKDPKPLDNLNLSYVVAKSAEGVRTKTFELTCTKTQKLYQFVAQTPKDMLQWVACINKRSSGKVKEESLHGNQTEEEENLYEPLKIVDEPDNDISDKNIKKSKPLPPLPSPNPQNTYVRRHPVPEPPPLDMEIYDPICAPDTAKTAPYNAEMGDLYDVIQYRKSIQQNEVRKPPPLPDPSPIQHRKLIATIRSDSSVTNSFSEDEEEALYAVLEQPPVAEHVRKPRPPDPEPEEEYCNLLCNLKENRQDLEPEEEYSNLIAFQSQRDQKGNQPEEEYSNLSLITADPNRRSLPKPPPRFKDNNQMIDEKQKNEEEEQPEYDCVVSASETIFDKGIQNIKSRLLNKNSTLDRKQDDGVPKIKPPVTQPKPQLVRKKY